jgi:K+-sensing histidine kinase KdpD
MALPAYTVVLADSPAARTAGALLLAGPWTSEEAVRSAVAAQPDAAIIAVLPAADPAAVRAAIAGGAGDWITVCEVETHLPAAVAVAQIRAQQAAEMRRLRSAAARRAHYLKALHEVALALSGNVNMEEALREVATRAMELLDGHRATVRLLDEATGKFRFRCIVGSDTSLDPSLAALGAGAAAARERRVIIVNDLANSPYNTAFAHTGSVSVIAAPLLLGNRVLGSMSVSSATPHRWREDDAELLALFANQAAVALENAQLYRKATERAERLAAMKDQLEELDRLKSEFIANVSHELRTPLGHIKGCATSLLRKDAHFDEATQREFLCIINEESDRLRRLIDELLDTSQIEAGALRLQYDTVRLSELIPQVAARAPRCAGWTERHRLVLRIPESLPPVAADPRRIDHVLMNLIENAVKYSPQGGNITVTARVEGRQIVVEISDEGIGIPPSQLAHIFERFYCVPQPRARRSHGTGLGLYICRGIIEAHGGTIEALSGGERGTTIRFTLPLRRAASERSKRPRTPPGA